MITVLISKTFPCFRESLNLRKPPFITNRTDSVTGLRRTHFPNLFGNLWVQIMTTINDFILFKW